MEEQTFTILHLNDKINVINTTNLLLTTHIGQCVKANIKEKTLINTAVVDETETSIYQLCYIDEKKNNITQINNIQLEQESNDEKKNLNYLASKLTINKQCIYNDCVLFKSKLTEDGSYMDDSTTIQDYNNIINKREIHIGCFSMHDRIKKITFTDPKKLEIDNWFLHSNQIFGGNGFNLEFVYQHNNTNKIAPCPRAPVNKFASVIAGIVIRGNCYILSKYGDEQYDDISIEILMRLYNVCRSPLSYKNISDEEMAPKKNNKNLLIIKNKYYFLKGREAGLEHKFNKCWVCNIASKLTCTGCYRLNYCSKECQIIDWKINNHKEDCLYELSKFIEKKVNNL